jgi:hypothetical protein
MRSIAARASRERLGNQALEILNGMPLGEYPRMRALYQELDFRWLKNYCGLPWLEYEAWAVVWKNLPHLSSLERRVRQLAKEGRIKLPEHLERERRQRQRGQ